MNIEEEKKYLYDMMKDITSERRELTKIYWELKSRLDDLIKLGIKGIEDTPITGVVDLHNARDMKLISDNLRRQTEHTIGKLEQAAIPEEKTVIPKAVVELEKEKVAKRSKSSRGIPLDKVTGIIAHTLKEHGIPMTVGDLYEKVNEQVDGQITRNNFRNNMLPRAAKKNTNINNISRGMYQYLNK